MAAASTKQIRGTRIDLVEFGRLLRMLWTIHFWSGAYLFDEISNRLDHQGPPIPQAALL
jgi:hypothetical protein